MDRTEDVEGKGYFADAVVAAGLKGRMTFHCLRHLFAVRLLTRGAPITVVSELLGHSDINLTVKRFTSDAKVKWRRCLTSPEPEEAEDRRQQPPKMHQKCISAADAPHGSKNAEGPIG